jgi:hypothetical protein
MRAILAALLLCLVPLLPAQAHGRHHVHLHRSAHARHHIRWSHRLRAHEVARGDNTGRPSDCYGIPWCGCFMRHLEGVTDRAFNLAREWVHFGQHAGGPGDNVIVVWSHHVGIIRGGPDGHGRYLVQSGNDGHQVRTRYRSLAGVIAYRRGA